MLQSSYSMRPRVYPQLSSSITVKSARMETEMYAEANRVYVGIHVVTHNRALA